MKNHRSLALCLGIIALSAYTHAIQADNENLYLSLKSDITTGMKRTKSLPDAQQTFLELQQTVKTAYPAPHKGQQEELLEILQKTYQSHLDEIYKHLEKHITFNIKRTWSLLDAKNAYLELQNLIEATYPDKYEGDREELITHLQDMYHSHVFKNSLVVKGSPIIMPGNDLLKSYKSLLQNLNEIISSTTDQNQSSLPSIFKQSPTPTTNPLQLELPEQLKTLKQTQKLLQDALPYHQQLVEGSDIQQKMNRLRTEVEAAYEKAIKTTRLQIDQVSEKKSQATCPYLMVTMIAEVPVYEQQLNAIADKRQKAETTYQAQKEMLSAQNNKSPEQLQQAHDKLSKKWNKVLDKYDQQCAAIITANMSTVINQLHKLKQLALAAQASEDKGGLMGIRKDSFRHYGKRIQQISSSLLRFAYPYMTEQEIKKALNAPFHPQQPEILNHKGFIHNQVIKLAQQDKQLYLKVRSNAIQEILKALELAEHLVA